MVVIEKYLYNKLKHNVFLDCLWPFQAISSKSPWRANPSPNGAEVAENNGKQGQQGESEDDW